MRRGTTTVFITVFFALALASSPVSAASRHWVSVSPAVPHISGTIPRPFTAPTRTGGSYGGLTLAADTLTPQSR